MSNLKEIYLFRHGENVQGGNYDFPLSTLGLQQSYQAGIDLHTEGNVQTGEILILVSPTLRTRQTAEKLILGLQDSNFQGQIHLEEDPNLRQEGGDRALLERIAALPETIDRIILVGHQRPFGLLRNIQTHLDQRYADEYLSACPPDERHNLLKHKRTPLDKAEIIGYSIETKWQNAQTPFCGTAIYNKKTTIKSEKNKIKSKRKYNQKHTM